jgi:hypothetical protein
MIGVFVGFSRIFFMEFLIFKGFTARRLYKSFGVKGLTAIWAEIKMTGGTILSPTHLHKYTYTFTFQRSAEC